MNAITPSRIAHSAAALLLLATSAFPQGSLTPPGAPAPTMKTLDQVQPRTPISSIPVTISKPGSYYLTQDVSGADGIHVTVSGVTIDLNGFAVIGPGKGAGGTGSGLVGQSDTTIRNGRVSDWPGDGIRLAAAVMLSDLDVQNIGGACITTGEQARATKCRASAGANGIVVGDSSIVDGCTSISNTAGGIVMGSLGVISDCVSSYNAGSGIATGDGSNVSRCVAFNNQGAAGIQVGSGCAVIDSTGRSNGAGTSGSGIAADTGATITHSTASANKGYGIYTNDAATIVGCTSLNNSSSGGFGIGIRTGSDSSVSGCTVTNNTGDGIQFVSRCLITSNVSSNNGKSKTGGNGLHSFGMSNRMDSNVVRVNAGAQIANDSGGSDTVIRNNIDNSGGIIFPPVSNSTGHNIAPAQNPDSATNPFANIVSN